MVLSNELESMTLPNRLTQALGPATRDAFAIFEDLCLLGPTTRIPPQDVCSRADREHTHELPRILPQGASLLPFTYPRPVCQQCSQCLSCSQHSELFRLSQHHPSPLLLKTLSSHSAFLLALRGTRVVFLLLCQLSSSSRQRPKSSSHHSSNSLLARLTRGEPRPGWMRVLAMEIMLR
jgi:hypothetical protein